MASGSNAQRGDVVSVFERYKALRDSIGDALGGRVERDFKAYLLVRILAEVDAVGSVDAAKVAALIDEVANVR